MRDKEMKLLPCPFCGAGAEVVESDEDGLTYCVSCNECYCNVGEAYNAQGEARHIFNNESEAITAWNTRAPSTARKEAFEEAVKLILSISPTR